MVVPVGRGAATATGTAPAPQYLLRAMAGGAVPVGSLPIVDVANELLALWDRPPIARTILEVRT